MKNTNLLTAKKAKNDEFYTRYEDIEREVILYTELLKDKTVYCNCDEEWSNFWKYFVNNFHALQLKHLVATGIKGVRLDYDGQTITKTNLISGDFRSDECVEILKQADIIITNPPFSLFRDFMDLLFNNHKKFLVIGNKNAVTFKNIFPHFANGEVMLGKFNDIKEFIGVNGEIVKFGNINWYQNLREFVLEPIELTCEYSPEKYPKYDNYDAINVDKIAEIPKDYYGIMGVPITFLNKWSTNQFYICGFRHGNDNKYLVYTHTHTHTHTQVYPYFRVLICRCDKWGFLRG